MGGWEEGRPGKSHEKALTINLSRSVVVIVTVDSVRGDSRAGATDAKMGYRDPDGDTRILSASEPYSLGSR